MCGELFSLNFEVDLNDDPGSFGGFTTTRKCTDFLGLIIMVLIFGAAIGLTVHCINNSEVEKLINGYDNCGNICGKRNLKTDSIPFDCFGKNFEKQKYLFIKDEEIVSETKINKTCVEFCSNLIGNYCAVNLSLIPIYIKFFVSYWWKILLTWIAIQVLSMNLIQSHKLKKQHDRPEVYIFGFILLAAFFTLSGYLRTLLEPNCDDYFKMSYIAGIIIIIMTIMMIPSFYMNYKKVDNIIQLFIEVKNATDLVTYWLLAFLSNIVIIVYIFGVLQCFLYLESFSYSEKIDELSPDEPIIEYIQYPIATTTQALLIYTIFLLYEFMKNLQTLIISGYVARRYFTKKDDEESKSSTTPLLKHLGTVCCASLILSATFPIRIVVNALKTIVMMIYEKCLYTCFRSLTTETVFFTRNGLIMTAIHGSSFCAGTIRARKLLHHNVFNAAAIYTFGDLRLLFIKVFIWVCVMLCWIYISKTSRHNFLKMEQFYLVCCGILFALLIDNYASITEIVIRTIFLCFCEDCVYNNGSSKPYFMSPEFAQFVENASKYVDADTWNTVVDKWNGGPGRLY